MPYPLIVSLILLLLPAVCFADGDCPDRPATAQERTIYSAVHSSVLSALPLPPQNWLKKDKTDFKNGELIPACPGGVKDSPHRYRFQFEYTYDSEVMARAAQGAAADALRGTPEQQSKLAALDKEHDELVTARKQTRKSGDQTAAGRIKDRLDQIRAEQNRLNEEINTAYLARVQSGEMSKAMTAGVPERRKAEVAIHINVDKVWAPKSTTVPVNIAGIQHAYWKSNDRGSLAILLGTWNWDASMLRATLVKNPMTMKPQTVVVEIAAERQMAEKLAREMKLDILKALLK